MLRAGAMEVCITPPMGVEMAGYGPDLGRFAIDIHDQLMAQALVLDDGQTKVAIVTSDLLGVTAEFTQTVRAAVQSRTGIPAENVMVTASHPHTSVNLRSTRGWGSADREYVKMAARYLAGAVVAAAGKLKPARLSVGTGENRWLAWNRTGHGTVDPTVGAVRLEAEDGSTIALLAYYSCHPVILGPKPTFSADYPGALREYLGDKYPGSVILFTNGVCGDTDPVTNSIAWGSGTFDDVKEAGEKLGDSVIDAAARAESIDAPHIHVRHGTMQLGYDLPSLDTVRDNIKAYAAEARRSKNPDPRFEAPSGEVSMPRYWLAYYRTLEKRIAAGKHPAYEDAELQVIAFDKTLALLAIPAEVYGAQGLQIRANSPYKITIPICYANGQRGYLPPRDEFARASYTAKLGAALHDEAPYRPDVGEVMVKASEGVLRETWKSS